MSSGNNFIVIPFVVLKISDAPSLDAIKLSEKADARFMADLWGVYHPPFDTLNIVSFLPKLLGRNQDFRKGFVWRGKSLFKVPGEKGFWGGI